MFFGLTLGIIIGANAGLIIFSVFFATRNNIGAGNDALSVRKQKIGR